MIKQKLIMIYVLLCLLCISAASIFSYLTQLRKTKGPRKTDKLLPGPRPWPIVGNAFMFASINTNKELWNTLLRIVTKYGKISRLFIGPKLMIVIADPTYVETIISGLAANEKDPYIFRYISDVFPGIFSISGDDWRDLRKPLNKLFHGKIMVKSHEVWVKKSKILLKQIEAKVGVFDIFDLAKFIVLDMICETHMGPLNINESEYNKYDIPAKLTRFEYIIFKRILKPHLSSNFIFNLTEEGKELKVLSNSFHEISLKMLEKRIEELKMNGTYNTCAEPECYTDICIEYGLKRNLSHAETARVITDFIIAGYEASAIVIGFLVLFLAIHSEYQEKVFEEQKEIFGDSDRPPTLEDIQNMCYLNRVFKETLRFCGAIGIVRKLSKDVHLDKYTLPKDATIYMMLQQIHKDPTYWERPNEFYPDHFIPEKVSQRPKGAYMPFSHGIRSCPGSQYGMLSIMTATSMIFRKFRLTSPVTMDKIEYQFGFLAESAVGYKVEAFTRCI